MPAIHNPNYQRPKIFVSGHLETIYPALFRKVKNMPSPVRRRINTSDDDFLDLDWWQSGNEQLLILQHGLEGSSDKPYILGMAKLFLQNGYDVIAWNFRGCSGEMNKVVRYYHSGATDDLDVVIKEALPSYTDTTLIGFSLGGNLILKYLGEAERNPKIRRAVAISAPLDLDSVANNLTKARGYIYERRFLSELKKKVIEKAKVMPDKINPGTLKKVKTLKDFDDYYTAPIHGFKDATDYYKNCSSKYFLKEIKVPTLILNALNDPLLTRECLDPKLVEGLENVILETTNYGGHVGFISKNGNGFYWSEKRALQFCKEH